MKKLYTLILLTTTGLTGFSTTWQVGPGKTYTKPSQVSTLVGNNDIVEIDAGTYTADVCNWTASNLTLKGVGGMAHLDANNTSKSRKAIWLIQGNNTTVENIEFSRCHDVAGLDMNWAGIRLEGTGLTVRNCYFHDNDDGILAGDNVTSDVLIEYTEFDHNGYGDGYSHNFYFNHLNSVTIQYCYLHHATIGHEAKTRAHSNFFLYNRIMNESTGDASREIDIPNGGLAVVMGNLIEQGANSTNSGIVGYGNEGTSNPGPHNFYFINNTVVNDRSAGTFVSLGGTTALLKMYNNIFAGPGTLLSGTPTTLDSTKNWRVTTKANAGLVNLTTFDYHLTSSSTGAINKGASAGSTSTSFSLTPLYEYSHNSDKVGRTSVSTIDIGAYEFGNPSGLAKTERPVPQFYVYCDEADESINVFFMNTNELKSAWVYDVTGKKILQQERYAGNKMSFSAGSLTAGIYFVSVQFEGGEIAAKKFIIK